MPSRQPARSDLVRDKVLEDVARLRAERRKLDGNARNLVSAIAENGTRESPSLLSELAHIERRIEIINKLLGETTRTAKLPDVPIERIREFVQRQASNMSTLLLSEPAAAKRALLLYFKPVVLTPRLTAGDHVFVVSGTNMLGAPLPSPAELEVAQNLWDRVRLRIISRTCAGSRLSSAGKLSSA